LGTVSSHDNPKTLKGKATMNNTTGKDWSRNSDKDTVANTGIIAVGVLAIILAVVSDFSEVTPVAGQVAQQHANVKVVTASTRLSAI
jgi:hypothetical protein